MQRRSATTGLIIEASCVLKETVRVLSEPERGTAMLALGTASRRVASCKTKAASSISEIVIVPWGLVIETKLATMSGVQDVAREVARPDSDLSWLGRATRLPILVPTRHITLYGWASDEQFMTGASVGTPPEGQSLSNWLAPDESPAIATPGPLPPDSAHAECGRGGPSLLAPKGA